MAKTSQEAKAKMKRIYPSRQQRRCFKCGRRHGFMRAFGLCRMLFQRIANKGETPRKLKSLGNFFKNMKTQYRYVKSNKNGQAVAKTDVLVPLSKIKTRLQKYWQEGIYWRNKKNYKGKIKALKISLSRQRSAAIAQVLKSFNRSKNLWRICREIRKVHGGYGCRVSSTQRSYGK